MRIEVQEELYLSEEEGKMWKNFSDLIDKMNEKISTEPLKTAIQDLQFYLQNLWDKIEDIDII